MKALWGPVTRGESEAGMWSGDQAGTLLAAGRRVSAKCPRPKRAERWTRQWGDGSWAPSETAAAVWRPREPGRALLRRHAPGAFWSANAVPVNAFRKKKGRHGGQRLTWGIRGIWDSLSSASARRREVRLDLQKRSLTVELWFQWSRISISSQKPSIACVWRTSLDYCLEVNFLKKMNK